MAVQLTVLVALTAPLGAVAEAFWLAAAQLLATTRGTTAPHGLWGELIGSAGRTALLVVLVGLLGFGVANLLRNTAPAFGVGFGHVAVVGNALRVLRPRWQEWLITDNAPVASRRAPAVHQRHRRRRPRRLQTSRQLHLTNFHGGLVLAGVTAVIVLVGVALFSRRDLD